MARPKKHGSAAAKKEANRLKSLCLLSSEKINEKRRVEHEIVDNRILYLRRPARQVKPLYTMGGPDIEPLSLPVKKPLSYHMNTLRQLNVATYSIFAAAGDNPKTYHKYVAMLFKDFMAKLNRGGTFHYLDPFLPPLTDLEWELDGVYDCVLKLAGPTSEDLAQVGDLQPMLCSAVLAIEEIQMRCLQHGKEELEWRYKNHLFRFQSPGRRRELL
ncbi:hypothetical protein BT96DRAFT_1005354 [Gymnopus androsaceus JB14]|uniref:Uncharacterized protein n=1 Tax=Gymnopus androsaceus JB14 TaxID=1447944 RepID=A0A6A4GNP7_9AGAR|nr:hypothetical protein BT96DRAFT_1005354 [Gymnopus androsaceus JB14]